MKLIDAGTAFHVTIKCVVLLALAFPLLGQTALAGDTVPGRSARRAAHVHHNRAMPVPTPPQQQPVAIVPMTPEQLPAEPPNVIYENGLLTIDSQNSTLAAVLNTIGRQIGAQLEMPPGAANERVAVHLSGSARQAISALLEGSGLNYVIMGSPDNPDAVQTVILTRMLPASGAREPQPLISTPPVTPQPAVVTSAPAPGPIPVAPALPFPAGQALERQQEQPPPGFPGATNQTAGGERQDMDCADLGLPPSCHQ